MTYKEDKHPYKAFRGKNHAEWKPTGEEPGMSIANDLSNRSDHPVKKKSDIQEVPQADFHIPSGWSDKKEVSNSMHKEVFIENERKRPADWMPPRI